MIEHFHVLVAGQGLHSITDKLKQKIAIWTENHSEGLCTLFIQHTSASLLIQENYDLSARTDLEHWLNRLVPEGDPIYTHTLEGADDMPAHIKAALTATSVSIPIINGELALGQWQGVYLWEHRRASCNRSIIIHLSQ